MWILLVEDDKMIVKVVLNGLKIVCYVVDWVNNGNMVE